MEVIRSSVKWKSALVFLDNIVVFSKTVKDAVPHLRQVLTLLRDRVVTIKLRKCSFLAGKIDYLEHPIR